MSYRINYQIRAEKLRVIDGAGKQLGILTRETALAKAKSLKLALIEIAPAANPPVAKIVDLGKFRYQEEKKLRSQQKRAKGGEIKEIRFSPFIAENDFNFRIERIREFLSDKDKVKVVVVFTGRQMGSTRFGYLLIKRILDILGGTVITDMEPKFFGRHLITIISPLGKKRVEQIYAEGKDKKVVN